MKIQLTLIVLMSMCMIGYAQERIMDDPREAEKHLKDVKQLTFGGDNAEAYFDNQANKLVFQSNDKSLDINANGCDQIYTYNLQQPDGDIRMISSGKGRNTCAYFLDDEKIIYASTDRDLTECKPARKIEGKYVWELYPEYEIYVQDQVTGERRPMTENDVYDAEATVSPDGNTIVYTSLESGDLELWTMDKNGENKKQITNELGYDGGAFFSPDGQYLIFRASRPKSIAEKKEYTKLLKDNLVAPTEMELFTCKIDGSEMKQITHLGKANWAPFFHPDGERIIFSSNHHSEKGYDFQLFMINRDGSGLEQISFGSIFNSFPMFSQDGQFLIFSSNRYNAEGTNDTNLFLARWED